MIEQYALDGKPIKKASCTIKTDEGDTIQIRVSGSATKALIDGFVQAVKKDQEKRWSE